MEFAWLIWKQNFNSGTLEPKWTEFRRETIDLARGNATRYASGYLQNRIYTSSRPEIILETRVRVDRPLGVCDGSSIFKEWAVNHRKSANQSFTINLSPTYFMSSNFTIRQRGIKFVRLTRDSSIHVRTFGILVTSTCHVIPRYRFCNDRHALMIRPLYRA